MESSRVDLNTFAHCRTISNLRLLVEESEGQKKFNRQRSLEASILAADAWQLLARAGQRATAGAIDETGHEVFFSAWDAIAVEIFLIRMPNRKRSANEVRDEVGGRCNNDKTSSGGERKAVEEAIEKAICRVAQAWNLVEGLEGEDVTDAEAIRELGILCFGDWRFRAAMVAARVESLAKAETSADGVEAMDCTDSVP